MRLPTTALAVLVSASACYTKQVTTSSTGGLVSDLQIVDATLVVTTCELLQAVSQEDDYVLVEHHDQVDHQIAACTTTTRLFPPGMRGRAPGARPVLAPPGGTAALPGRRPDGAP
jgi:hypothetical protein